MKLTEFKKHRFLSGISQHDFAQKTGIPQPKVSLLENGRMNPTEKEMILFSMILKIPVKKLFPENK